MSTETNARDELGRDIQRALNWASIDSLANTPDFELADKLMECPYLASYQKPFYLSPGLYRNTLGAEIEVISLEMARHIIGPVWNAYQNDSLFPRHLIVTPEGMRDAGYERVGDAP